MRWSSVGGGTTLPRATRCAHTLAIKCHAPIRLGTCCTRTIDAVGSQNLSREGSHLTARTPAQCQPRAGRARSAAARPAVMPAAANGGERPLGGKVTLAVVGDIHEQWGADDEAALLSLGADVAVFLGDIGNEDARWGLWLC